MPHCIIEYANQPELISHVDAFIDGVFQGALSSQLFEAEHIKIRAMAFDHYQVGEGDKSFVHVMAKILSGRTLEQRQTLANCILEQLNFCELKNISYTVEVIEMERASYAKKVS